MATYRAVMLTKKGGPEVLETVDLPIRDPEAGEARIRVVACGAGATDVLMRRGYYPYAPKIPFVPGYEIVGIVDAIGANVTNVKPGDKVCALTVWGGYAELLYRGADELVPVPPNLDDAEVVALILNYMTAYQMVHRVGQQQPRETALVTGANGGVGQALLELLAIAGVTTYGSASQRSHALVQQLGGIPLDSARDAPIDRTLRAALPDGVDATYDALGGKYVARCIGATKRGGQVIGYGFSGAVDKHGHPSTLAAIRGYWSIFVAGKVRGRRTAFYGITRLYRQTKQPFLEDMQKLLALLADKKLHPKISARLPLLAARQANELIEAGGVDGKIVLLRAA